MVNQEAQPATSELTYDGQRTEEYWERMFGSDSASTNQIERLSAVWACVYVLASALGTMGIQMMKRDGTASKIETSHRTAGFLKDRPSDLMTWPEFKEATMWQLLFRGNAYTQNFSPNGFLREVFLWDQGSIMPKRLKRKLAYEVGGNEFDIPARNYFRPDIAHFKGMSSNGVLGISPIEHCKNALMSAEALGKYQLTSAKKGGPLKGIITGVEPFRNEELAKKVRSRWSEAFDKAQAGSGVPIFEGAGMKFNSVSMTNTDAQFLEQMRFSVEDVARIFNIPPHQIQHLEKATNNNIDLLNQEFYKSSLMPWKNRLEAVMNSDWLSAADRRAGYVIMLNPEDFLRADLEKWTNSLAKQVSGGLRTPNEARERLDLSEVDDGDQLRVPANTVPVGYDPSEANGTAAQPTEQPPQD